MIATDMLDQILGQLHQVRLQCPSFRFGQLIATIGILAEDETGHSIWDLEDADFAAALERFAEDMARRRLDQGERSATEVINGKTLSP